MSLTEFQLHKQAAEYFRTVLAPDVLWWHTPLNPKSAKHGAWLKQMGMQAGVPDFLLLWGYGFVPRMILGIELKVGRGKQNPAQIDFAKRLNETGGQYFVCYSITELERALKFCHVPTRGKLAA